jgi:hypothetical protein
VSSIETVGMMNDWTSAIIAKTTIAMVTIHSASARLRSARAGAFAGLGGGPAGAAVSEVDISRGIRARV